MNETGGWSGPLGELHPWAEQISRSLAELLVEVEAVRGRLTRLEAHLETVDARLDRLEARGTRPARRAAGGPPGAS
jgi:predicted nuclease with TOPRIM domain